MSRTPDLVLSVMDKTTGARSGKIGAAWHNEDGSISLVLNPGSSLAYNPNLVVMLFPNTPPLATNRAHTTHAPKSKHQKWVEAGMPVKGSRKTATVKEGLGARTPAASIFGGLEVDEEPSLSPPVLPFPHGKVSVCPDLAPRKLRVTSLTKKALKISEGKV